MSYHRQQFVAFYQGEAAQCNFENRTLHMSAGVSCQSTNVADSMLREHGNRYARSGSEPGHPFFCQRGSITNAKDNLLPRRVLDGDETWHVTVWESLLQKFSMDNGSRSTKPHATLLRQAWCEHRRTCARTIERNTPEALLAPLAFASSF